MAVRIAIVALFLGTIVAAQDWLLPEWRAEQRAHMEKLAAIRPSAEDANLQRCGAQALLRLDAPRALPLVLERLGKTIPTKRGLTPFCRVPGGLVGASVVGTR